MKLLFFFVDIILLNSLVCNVACGGKDWSEDQSPEKWHAQAKQTIESILKIKPNRNLAKNLGN